MERGDVVTSRCGSDAGTVYVVLEAPVNSRVLLANGRRHPLHSPKKKNVRHVKSAGTRVDVPDTDAALAKIIESLNLSGKS